MTSKKAISLSILRDAVKMYGAALAVSFNGGKDSVVTVNLLREVCEEEQRELKDFTFIRFCEREDFVEMESFITTCSSVFGVEILCITGSDLRDSMKHLKIVRSDIRALVMGTRQTDPGGAKLSAFAKTTEGWPEFVRISPILCWSYSDVWRYIRENGLPYCSLYELGYTSIGGKYNTVPNPRLRRSSGYAAAWELEDDSCERDGRI